MSDDIEWTCPCGWIIHSSDSCSFCHSTYKPQHIEFKIKERKPKTNVYSVISMHDYSELGTIKWYGGWQQYVFYPNQQTFWSNDCLENLTRFMNALKNRKKKVTPS